MKKGKIISLLRDGKIIIDANDMDEATILILPRANLWFLNLKFKF